jgi:maltose alpha-D-glucosyltransferase/alpha-amylase
LRVITELVLNHTSDQHAWFQRSRSARPGTGARDFYVWSDTPEKYKDARIIFKDFESSNWAWDPVAKSYYWHRFYSHQPDLNYDKPEVRRAMLDTVDFWLDMGVDGLRLDAVPYLFEREGTSCENLPETHEFLKALRSHVDSKYRDRMLLAEANQWPDDAVAYFGNGDECHMAFHFPLMPRLFMAHRREDRFPIVDILQQTPPVAESCQWALFLRNHDELTLEMVTDEERDYMYRAYARDPQMRINLGIRRRLAPLLGNHRRRMELMNALLFSLPGTPIIYYGDEIGMGDNIYLGDRNGVRTPMQWNADRNAGFSKANPQRLYLPVIIDPEYHYEAVNVEAQQNNPHSLLWWMKRLIALRKQSKALSRGAIEFLQPENHRVLAFIRRFEEERVLVVANLSRFSQPVELDLSAFKGMSPVEMFGRVEFPPIAALPYFITIAPHSFYLFTLEQVRTVQRHTSRYEAPVVDAPAETAFQDAGTRQKLAGKLPSYLMSRRWFRGKANTIRSAEICDLIPFGESSWTLVRVQYREGDPEIYSLPAAIAAGRAAQDTLPGYESTIAVRLRSGAEESIVYDAAFDRRVCSAALDAIARRKRFKGENGELIAGSTRLFRKIAGEDANLHPSIQSGEQSNTSVVFGDRLILKLFRRLEPGTNPDLEIGRFLTEHTSFRNIAPVAGWLQYEPARGESMTVGILQGYVPNRGDAWSHTIDSLGRFFERALAASSNGRRAIVSSRDPLDLIDQVESREVTELGRGYLEDTQLLGQRTAELHIALGARSRDPAFGPEPFSAPYQQGLYHSMISLTNSSLQLLRRSLGKLPAPVQESATGVLALENDIRSRFRPVRDAKLTGMRTRHHGDYHLGQVLWTGRDYVIIDFEGEPARPLTERQMKRSPLRDVAGMLRSFHYASSAVLFGHVPAVMIGSENREALASWARWWYLWVSATFLKAYLTAAADAPFLPRTREEFRMLLNAFLLEKAVYEIGYELNNRPEWLAIPLEGIRSLVERPVEE